MPNPETRRTAQPRGGQRLALMALVCATHSVLAADAPLQPAEITTVEVEVIREWNAMQLDGQWQPDHAPEFRKKVRRLFAASPSFTSLALYASGLSSNDGAAAPNDTDKVVVQEEFAEMKSALTRDFSKEKQYPPAFQGLALTTQVARGGHAPAGSLFSRADEVAGWGHMNEPFFSPTQAHGTPTAHYAVNFDGPSFASLSPVYELAKHLRKNVTVELSNHPVDDREQAAAVFDINTAVLTTELPAYAITRRGLIPGKFTRIGFFGSGCSDRQPTAEFTFAEPVNDVVLSVFVTGVNINTTRAHVQVAEQLFPSFGDEINGGAIRKRLTYSVDLNGDGIAELRGVSQRDAEPDDDDIYSMGGSFFPTPRMIPVAGWYPNDFDYLDANIGGRWLRLSTYHAPSCE
jgi:hypothetical protein